MINKKEETVSLLRQILAEQKKQTKILEAIVSSKEQYKTEFYLDTDSVAESINKKPKGSVEIPLNV